MKDTQLLLKHVPDDIPLYLELLFRDGGSWITRYIRNNNSREDDNRKVKKCEDGYIFSVYL